MFPPTDITDEEERNMLLADALRKYLDGSGIDEFDSSPWGDHFDEDEDDGAGAY